jgi:hypothetical protein
MFPQPVALRTFARLFSSAWSKLSRACRCHSHMQPFKGHPEPVARGLVIMVFLLQVDQAQLDKLFGGDGTGPRSRFGNGGSGGSGFAPPGAVMNTSERPLATVPPINVEAVGPPPAAPVCAILKSLNPKRRTACTPLLSPASQMRLQSVLEPIERFLTGLTGQAFVLQGAQASQGGSPTPKKRLSTMIKSVSRCWGYGSHNAYMSSSETAGCSLRSHDKLGAESWQSLQTQAAMSVCCSDHRTAGLCAAIHSTVIGLS